MEILEYNEGAAALFRKIGEGDRSALIALYDRTHRLVFGIVGRILGDKTTAEETLLDVYTHVWTHPGSYDPKTLAPMEWLMTVARTRAVARLYWNRQERKRRTPPAGDGNTAMTVAPEHQRIARSAVASLVPAQREILESAYYSGLSAAEIAAQIGKPIGAVRTHARIALNKLDALFRPFSKPEESRDEGKNP
jgi:RNA polymerase sigma-70 factor (ECF subfamily)